MVYRILGNNVFDKGKFDEFHEAELICQSFQSVVNNRPFTKSFQGRCQTLFRQNVCEIELAKL